MSGSDNLLEVVVLSKTLEADEIFSFELARSDMGGLPPFEAGAHIDVHLPNGIVRQYSLCNPPGPTGRYLIGVLKDPSTRGGSIALHDQVRVGDRLQISPPRNLFPLAENAARSLLFAGGIGITPMLCMAESLSAAKADFELHYVAHSRRRMAFLERIQSSAFAQQARLYFGSAELRQKLETDQLLAEPEPGTHIYVCGPGRFIDYVLESAKANGWPSQQLHREYFSAPVSDQASDASFEVEIKSTGAVIPIPADKSVLQALEEAGIYIPVACEEGVCGTCLTRILEGEPEHRDVFMSEAEHALNNQFTPCCSRARSSRLLLDL